MKKVLVVDDTKNIRNLLTKCLEIEGFEVKTAMDGKQALEFFMKETFDLAFLDIKMPNFSGTEVMKKIRSLGISVPIIIITAYPTIKNAFECTQMGAVAYLQKPFTADKVRAVLSEISFANNVEIKEEDLLEKSKSLISEGRFREAIFVLKRLLLEQTLHPQIYFLLSKAYEGLERNTEAKKYIAIYEILKTTN